MKGLFRQTQEVHRGAMFNGRLYEEIVCLQPEAFDDGEVCVIPTTWEPVSVPGYMLEGLLSFDYLDKCTEARKRFFGELVQQGYTALKIVCPRSENIIYVSASRQPFKKERV